MNMVLHLEDQVHKAVHKLQDKTVKVFPNKWKVNNVGLYQENNAKMSPDKAARMYPSNHAKVYQNRWKNKFATTFQDSNVNK